MMIAMMMTTMVVVMDVFWFWFELWFPHVLKVAFLVSLMRSCRGLTVIQKQAAEDKSTFSWVLTIGTKAFSVNFDFKIGCENIDFWNLISCWAFFSLIMANIPRPSKVNKQPTYPTLRGAQIGWTFGGIKTFLSDPGVPGVRSMGPVVSHWVSELPLCRLNWCDSGWWRYELNTNW